MLIGKIIQNHLRMEAQSAASAAAEMGVPPAVLSRIINEGQKAMNAETLLKILNWMLSES